MPSPANHVREKLSGTISSLRQCGGGKLVVSDDRGAVLATRSGTFEFSLLDPLEVSPGTDPGPLSGTAVVTITEARAAMLEVLEEQERMLRCPINAAAFP